MPGSNGQEERRQESMDLLSEVFDSRNCNEDVTARRILQGIDSVSRPSDRVVMMAIEESADCDCRKTLEIRAHVDALRPCPIDFEPMLEPVRLLHADEAERKGPPHVFGRASAQRWLKDSNSKCPLCRGLVVGLQSDVEGEQDLVNSIAGLAKQCFQGGDNLLHKAAKLADAHLFRAVGRLLDEEDICRMILQENDQGQKPLALLEALHSPSQCEEFFSELPHCNADQGAPLISYCPRAEMWSGTSFWATEPRANEAPVFIGVTCMGSDGHSYKVCHTVEKLVQPKDNEPEVVEGPPAVIRESQIPSRFDDDARFAELDLIFDAFETVYRQEEEYYQSCEKASSRKAHDEQSRRWGTSVLLRVSPACGSVRKKEFCICPILRSLAPRSSEPGQDDEEVFEPALRIKAKDQPEKAFHARMASSRGLWIGGTEHFDNYIIPREAGVSAFVIFDPLKVEWKVYPGDSTSLSIVSSGTTSTDPAQSTGDVAQETAAPDTSKSKASPGNSEFMPPPRSGKAAAVNDANLLSASAGVAAAADSCCRATFVVDPGTGVEIGPAPMAPLHEGTDEQGACGCVASADSVITKSDQIADTSDQIADTAAAAPSEKALSELANVTSAVPTDSFAGVNVASSETANTVGKESISVDDTENAEAGMSSTSSAPSVSLVHTEGDCVQDATATAESAGSVVSSSVSTSTGLADGNTSKSAPVEGLVLKACENTTVKLTAENGHCLDVVLEPCFLARRWTESSQEAGLTWATQEAVSPAEARLMRKRVVLANLTLAVQNCAPLVSAADRQAYVPKQRICAILSELSIGRGEAADLCISEVVSVSRSHCVVELLSPCDIGTANLVVYDEGSLAGTQVMHNGITRNVGVGQTKARQVQEGDEIILSGDVRVKLKDISEVLSLDDPDGLARFFERLGDRKTAWDLRSEPRHTEWILSSSVRLSMESDPPQRVTEGLLRPPLRSLNASVFRRRVNRLPAGLFSNDDLVDDGDLPEDSAAQFLQDRDLVADEFFDDNINLALPPDGHDGV